MNMGLKWLMVKNAPGVVIIIKRFLEEFYSLFGKLDFLQSCEKAVCNNKIVQLTKKCE
jgi:hypothetical protein